MRTVSLVVLAAFGAVAVAQNLLDQIPKCAQECFGNSLGQCNALDIACVCGNSTLIASLSCCISQQCKPEEQEAVIKFAGDLCRANGVEVPTSAACTGSSSTSTPAPSSSAPSSHENHTEDHSTTAAPTDSPSTTPTQAPATQTTGAAPLHTGMGAVLGLGVAGLLAAL